MCQAPHNQGCPALPVLSKKISAGGRHGYRVEARGFSGCQVHLKALDERISPLSLIKTQMSSRRIPISQRKKQSHKINLTVLLKN